MIPNDPDDGEFREECALAAGLILEYLGESSETALDDPLTLGGMVVGVAALAKMQGMDLHELLGSVMSAYRGTNVQTLDLEDDDEEAGGDGDGDGTRH